MAGNNDDYDIDVVVMWVDGNDPAWQKVYKECRFGDAETDFNMRYRDWGIFKYWFRGIDKFMPWVRKVHFVTWGHLPEWLDTTNPKLHVVRHEDYIPAEFLPTFNSTVLEKFFHRIEGLAEHFVYFNDDAFVIKSMKREDFFKEGKVVDILSFEPICAYSYVYWGYEKLNESTILARHFNKKEGMKKHFWHYFSFKYPLKYKLYNASEFFYPHFTSILSAHNPSPMLKSTYEELWECEREALELSAKNKFRGYNDTSQVIFKSWTMLKGKLIPKNVYKSSYYCSLTNNNEKTYNIIRKQKYQNICINDGENEDTIEYEKVRDELISAFESILPDKCPFEK